MAPGSSLPVAAKFLPRVHLTPEDEHELKILADESLNETLAQYEEFLYAQNKAIDKKRWKLVKQCETVQVFKERETAATAPPTSSSASGSRAQQQQLHRQFSKKLAIGAGPKAAMAAASRMPLMLVHGTIQGTVEDAMYGSYVDDTSSLRRRSTYEKDLMEDSAILATLETPSLGDPFHHLNVSWLLRDFPGLNAVVKRRDFLLLNKTGLTTTSRGERIGYCLVHSIQHRDLPDLTQAGIVRAKLSFCLIIRQVDSERIELFNQTVVDPGGNLMAFFVVQESAETLLSCGKMMHSAHKKKLFYFMRKQARVTTALTASRAHYTSPLSHSSSSSCHSSSASVLARYQFTGRQVSDHCAACEKALGGFFSSGGCFCQICQKMICSRCSLKKNIVIEATEKKVVLKPFVFCIVCTIKAKNFPAEQIHVEELRERQFSI